MKSKLETIILVFLFIFMLSGAYLILSGLCRTTYQAIIQQAPEQETAISIESEYIEEEMSKTE